MTATAYLSIGSNLGDRRRTLEEALDRLQHDGVLRVVRRSSVYESSPVGKTDQPWFLNMVVEISTGLSPAQLLARCQRVEKDLGRVRRERWGPRTVDIDILLYGEQSVATPSLVIPHPEMMRRRFVLEPLLEIAPDVMLPDGRRLDTFLAGVTNQDLRREAS